MDQYKAEKIINKIRFIFAFFFLFVGLSSMRSGSVEPVYLSILIGAGCQFVIAIVNESIIRLKKIKNIFIYISVTFEISIIFFVKFAFHYDPFNSWGLAIKEQSTFILFIMYGIIHALRFNKALNLYVGAFSILCYVTLIVLGLEFGNMEFVRDAKLIFTPNALRLPTELAIILFMAGNTYFLYLMARFTKQNVTAIENARYKAHENLKATNGLIENVRRIATNLASSIQEMTATTMSLAENMQTQSAMEEEIIQSSSRNVESIDELASNSETQSVTYRELSGRVKELSVSIDELNMETTKSLELTQSITRQIADGEKAIKSTNETMLAIGESSDEMTNIMSFINDISDQINLLSLNAAIESARAGEAGRGFAVVADEISKLADKTAQSIKDIETLVKTNTSEIQKGMQSVKYLSGIIRKIIDDISAISELINKISNYMHTQQDHNEKVTSESGKMQIISRKIDESLESHRTAIKSISGAIKKIGTVGQDNSSATEEMAANTEEVAGMAEKLKSLLDDFKYSV